MNLNPIKPFNQLPLIPPSMDVETKEILKLSAEARIALESFRTTVELIPNRFLVLNIFPILEAQANCAIENIHSSTDNLFKGLIIPSLADLSTKDVLRNRSAVFIGLASIFDRPLAFGIAKEVCSILRGVDVELRNIPGTHLENANTGEVIYTPPSEKDILYKKIFNWEEFINTNQELDPLVAMAIAHYQFEAIHPFSDGNGRTGRILNLLFLVQRNLLVLPVLCLSKYILDHKLEYYRKLISVTEKDDWLPWIKFMLEAVRTSAIQNKKKIIEICKLEEKTIRKMQEIPEVKNIYSKNLVHLLFSLPYVGAHTLVEEKIAKKDTASQYLKTLCDHNLLKEIPTKGKNIYLNQPLLDIINQNN